MARVIRQRSPYLAIIAVLIGVIAFNVTGSATATHQPANKVAIDGQRLEIQVAQLGAPGTQDQTVDDVLHARMRVATPTDLILSLTAECALWTNTVIQGDDDQTSTARVEMWITIDGTIVPVSGDDVGTVNGTDPREQSSVGRIVFCNRAQRMTLANYDDIENNSGDPNEGEDDDAIWRLYNRSRSSNAFNWIALDVGRDYDANGDNILDIIVFARLVAKVECLEGGCPVSSDGESPGALSAVGKRTLVIEPVKLPNDASI